MISSDSLCKKWPRKSLGEVVEFLDNLRRPVKEQDRKDGPYPYYGANGIQGYIDGFLLDEPTILLAEDGGHFGNPERTIAYQVDGRYWVNNHAHILRPKPDVDIRFLCRQIEQYDVTPFVTGTTRGKLTKGAAERIPVVLPPLPEQRRIAAILDQADGVRRKRQAALALTDQFLRSTFLEMFGDPVRNPKGWEVVTIGELLQQGVLQVHKDGNFGSAYPKAHEFGSEGIPFLTAKCVTDDGNIVDAEIARLNETKAKTLSFGWIRSGDVLLAHNATVGRVAHYDGRFPDALIGTSLTCFRADPSRLNSRFLFALLQTSFFQSQLFATMSQTTRNQVPITEQRKLKVVIPSLSQQNLFADVMAQTQELRTKLWNASASTSLCFSSLVHRAFRGEL